MIGRRPVSALPLLGAVLRYLIAAMAGLIAYDAAAQTGASVTLVSDYRFRGVSLSGKRPALQTNLEQDFDNGWYAGLFASSARIDEDGSGSAQVESHAGYSRRLHSGWSWDGGASLSVFPHDASYNYGEIFTGLATENFSGKLYFSPNYFGRNVRTLYAELNDSYSLRKHVRLFGHLGFLCPLAGAGTTASSKGRTDVQLGVRYTHTEWSVQASWIGSSGQYPKYPYAGRNRNATVLSVSYFY
jgi:uncharacterized protein (TIGR02001 family)